MNSSWNALFLFIIMVVGCQSNPSKHLLTVCPQCKKIIIPTDDGYALNAFYRVNIQQQATLHIYLEGDGRPWWRNGRFPAGNPNSKSLTALGLMTHDPFPAIYLNRPCYGFPRVPDYCDKDLWTAGRYSETVVRQLDNALTQIRETYGNKQFVLIGHSGGGTLAMLIAHRRQDIVGILTISANLNHRKWTDFFGYTELYHSLNPSDFPVLPKTRIRWHLIGRQDRVVPFDILFNEAQRDPYAHLVIEEQYDHHCCWQKNWGAVISKFRDGLLQNQQ